MPAHVRSFRTAGAVLSAAAERAEVKRLTAENTVLRDVCRDVAEVLEDLRTPAVPDPDLETLIARVREAAGDPS